MILRLVVFVDVGAILEIVVAKEERANSLSAFGVSFLLVLDTRLAAPVEFDRLVVRLWFAVSNAMNLPTTLSCG